MQIIGCDFHPSYQQIAWLDEQTGELRERSLEHTHGEAQRFYQALAGPVRVGMEAVGNAQWFERLLAELGHELWVGDAARIRALVVRRQKTDRRDAVHLLELPTTEAGRHQQAGQSVFAQLAGGGGVVGRPRG